MAFLDKLLPDGLYLWAVCRECRPDEGRDAEALECCAYVLPPVLAAADGDDIRVKKQVSGRCCDGARELYPLGACALFQGIRCGLVWCSCRL